MSYLSHTPNGINPSSRFSTLKVFKLRSGSASGSSDSPPPPPPPKDPAYAPSPNPSLSPPPAFYNKSLFSRSAASLSPSLSPESNSGPVTPLTPYSTIGIGSDITLECGKGPASGRGCVNGRGTTASPVPSASGASLRSVSGGASSGGGGEHLASPSVDGSTDSGGCYLNPNPEANLGMHSIGGADSTPYSMGQASTNGKIKPKKSIFKFSTLGKRNKRDLSDGSGVSGSASRSASINESEDGAVQREGDQGITRPWNFQHHIHVDEA
ncbi:hypothetical protein PAXRUDRAFT_584837 [Paxillus rubicundulus Ve08.2h10]|uniref:CRIB domain-containing protein n=1 Tax=Paxillus rubicundulus Ve08.2h10 TaxID=930991 RepID=A0A0D0E4P6_9AGAM|nr:hypothetical protein PAXRUDRAFT_584837 [Paxillus rubicundulus Ve08.2h10]